MSDMTPDKATALRQPFPKESIGKLPKPYKRESPKGNCADCGGYHGLPAAHLDYAGHAAVTDRLLTVDPEWSWEPMAFDQYGSPQTDRDGNLWIKLTICGVTRLGVGDGSSMKERIGDAIRNAAMRFGVGLDLWAKENLVEFAQAARSHQAAPDELEAGLTARVADTRPTVLLKTTSPLAKAMYATINEAGIPETERISTVSEIIGREITSTKEMTEDEARKVLDRLSALLPQAAGAQ